VTCIDSDLLTVHLDDNIGMNLRTIIEQKFAFYAAQNTAHRIHPGSTAPPRSVIPSTSDILAVAGANASVPSPSGPMYAPSNIIQRKATLTKAMAAARSDASYTFKAEGVWTALNGKINKVMSLSQHSADSTSDESCLFFSWLVESLSRMYAPQDQTRKRFSSGYLDTWKRCFMA